MTKEIMTILALGIISPFIMAQNDFFNKIDDIQLTKDDSINVVYLNNKSKIHDLEEDSTHYYLRDAYLDTCEENNKKYLSDLTRLNSILARNDYRERLLNTDDFFYVSCGEGTEPEAVFIALPSVLDTGNYIDGYGYISPFGLCFDQEVKPTDYENIEKALKEGRIEFILRPLTVVLPTYVEKTDIAKKALNQQATYLLKGIKRNLSLLANNGIECPSYEQYLANESEQNIDGLEDLIKYRQKVLKMLNNM